MDCVIFKSRKSRKTLEFAWSFYSKDAYTVLQGESKIEQSNKKVKTKKACTKEGDDTMAAISKPVNKIVVIDSTKSRQFIKDFNNNKATKDFLDSCKKAGRLFRKDK